jgi:hypothetical protein
VIPKRLSDRPVHQENQPPESQSRPVEEWIIITTHNIAANTPKNNAPTVLSNVTFCKLKNVPVGAIVVIVVGTRKLSLESCVSVKVNLVIEGPKRRRNEGSRSRGREGREREERREEGKLREWRGDSLTTRFQKEERGE